MRVRAWVRARARAMVRVRVRVRVAVVPNTRRLYPTRPH